MISLAVFDDQDAAIAAERPGEHNLAIEGCHHLRLGARLYRNTAMGLARLADLPEGEDNPPARRKRHLAMGFAEPAQTAGQSVRYLRL
jgi:DNA-binding IclR family transcriptional regulator